MSATLYYTPTSCSAASYMAAEMNGTKLKTVLTDIRAHKTADGTDFYTINPKGNVPALVLADGTMLNENTGVLNWIADQNPAAGLAPPQGTSARYLHECKLGWVASELHPAMGVLFNPTLTPPVKEAALARLDQKLTFMEEKELGGKFLVDDKIYVADLYAAVVLSWGQYLGVDISKYPKVNVYMNAVFSDPKVAAAQQALMASAK